MVRRILFIILISLFANTCWSASIEARLDRNPVTANESFTLTFNVQGEPSGDPDFSPLETYFDILNQSQNSRIQIINGNMDSTKEWQLTLLPRNPGTYTLPAIEFGNDRSNTLILEVKAQAATSGADDNSVVLEAELSPESGYVQGQLVYTMRLLRSINLRNGTLSEPNISGVEAMIEKLGEDNLFETQRNGVRYVVVERRYAIFPQQSGTLIVAPTIFQGQIVKSSRSYFNETIRSKRLASKPFSVEIQAIPAQARRPWLPARAVHLQEEWADEPPAFRVGEPVTRTLTLSADGIAAAQLPILSQNLPDGLKQYPDKPLLQDDNRSTGLFGFRQEKIAIMPSRPGRYTLPAIEIPWWNVQLGRQEIARLPARSIEVAAAEGAQQPAPMPVTQDDKPVMIAPAPSTVKADAGFWPWLSATLTLGWAATILLWWRQRRTPRQSQRAQPPSTSYKAVKKACKANDAHACKRALLSWATAQWPARPPTSLGAIATRVDRDFSDSIATLNRALYAREGANWNGTALLGAAQHWIKSANAGKNKQPESVASLHPLRERTYHD